MINTEITTTKGMEQAQRQIEYSGLKAARRAPQFSKR